MLNVNGLSLRIMIGAVALIVSACNPLASKTNIDKTFTPGFSIATIISPIAGGSTVSASATSIAADGVATSTITVILSDNTNVLASKIVTLSSSRGADVLSATAALTNSLGVATFTVTSTLSGTAFFTTVDSTDGVVISQKASVTFTAGAADHLAKISGDNQSGKVSAPLASALTVQAQDRYDNPVSGVVLSFIPSRGGGFVSASKVTTGTDGNASVTYTSGTIDTTAYIDVKRMTTPLADLAVTGRSTVKFVETSVNTGTGVFDNPQYLVGTSSETPYVVETGDFNEDGKPDLVVSEFVGNKVGIFLGQGNGKFATRVDYAAGTAPRGIAIADFNGDGHQDLAVADWNQNGYVIMLGNGDGTFQPKVTYATGHPNPGYIAAGDFNADGKIDLAISNSGSGNISVVLGVGDGTFGAETLYAVNSGPLGIVTKDFNGDGKLDLAVVNFLSANVSILLGNGNGTFNAKTDFATGNNPESLAIGDVNADTKWDLVVANSSVGSNSISVLTGVGNGTFNAKVDYAAGPAPYTVALKDLNGDGALDIVATDNNAAGKFVVLIGNTLAGVATGTFAAKVDYPAGYNATGLVLVDLDLDGKLDAAMVDFGSGYLSVKKGVGNGTFKNFNGTTYVTGTTPYNVVNGDFNGDGVQDLAVSNYASGTVSVFIGIKSGGVGTGNFLAKVDYATGNSPNHVYVGDFNEDGILDLAVTDTWGTNKIAILIGRGDGTFNPKVNYTSGGTNPWSLGMADINNDGHIDLIVGNFQSSTYSIYLGAGDGTFVNSSNFASAQTAPGGIATGDFNLDGKPDFAAVNYNSGTLSIVLGNGNGTFQAEAFQNEGYSGPFALMSGDFNGDSKLDLATTGCGNWMNAIAFYSGNSNGTFANVVYPLVYSSGSSPMGAKSGDFNGDGKLDVASANSGNNRIDIYTGNGNGTFNAPMVYNSDQTASDVVFADFNGDGKLDAAFVSQASNSLTIEIGN